MNKIFEKLEILKLYICLVNGSIFFEIFVTFVLQPLQKFQQLSLNSF